jgi:hypothetical protein
MRNAARVSLCGRLVVAAASFAAGLVTGCSQRHLPDGNATGGTGVIVGSGGVGVGVGGGPGTGGATGSGGGAGAGAAAGISGACTPSDPRLLLADQRILPLTSTEMVNTVRYLIDDTEATKLVTDGVVTGDDSVPSLRRFPPLQTALIDGNSFPERDRVASHVADYVLANFETVGPCGTSPSDDCAKTYLAKLAGKAYRRQPTADELTRVSALYNKLRSGQTVNGYQVTYTIEEATSLAIQALLMSPQVLWRWEIGDPASTSLAGVPLTDQELATQLAFFFTDQPPDSALLNIANAGQLRANLTTYVNALLTSQTAQDWLRTIMETYFRVNTLPRVTRDPAQVPTFNAALAVDMGIETQMFLDHVLWKEDLSGLLLSRRAFLNTNLASNIYALDPPPAGSSITTFAETALPIAERSGLLTNPGFLTVASPADPHHALVPRGLLVASLFLCRPRPPVHPDGLRDPSSKPFSAQTSQEQVATRGVVPCNACHPQFDPYGLALDNYDGIGRYRTIDDLGQPVDAHAQLPADLGGFEVANAVELAQALSTKPEFTSCMARALLQYAMVDAATTVEVPLSSAHQSGCATADLVQRYQTAGGSTFTDLVRATVAAPAFGVRRAAP